MATRLGGVDALTPREMEVLRLLGQGLSNRNIATRLEVNERTIKYHVGAILAKLEASNRTQAVMLAIERGLITLENRMPDDEG
jgi:two-component system NarL family response regulator